MVCHGFKGGTGTASRIVTTPMGETYTLGVLVQANHGKKEELLIRGIPVGKEIVGCDAEIAHRSPKEGSGSIIVIFATDAPFLPWQLSKIARRATMGIALCGGGYHSSSGDIFLAFSTGNKDAFTYTKSDITYLSDENIDVFFKAATEAVEESILNALVAGEDMWGRNRNHVYALPHDQLRTILKKYENVLAAY
jgi:L-aminopeptidase/D-esterase-like protein